MYQAMIFSFKVSQHFIVYESAEDRNLRVFFNRVKNSLTCNIFTKYYCNWDAFLSSPVNLGIFEAQHQTNCNRIVFNAI